jgi:hypothetical protein
MCKRNAWIYRREDRKKNINTQEKTKIKSSILIYMLQQCNNNNKRNLIKKEAKKILKYKYKYNACKT